MLEELNKVNSPLTILHVDSPALSRYGKKIEGIDCSEMFERSLMEVNYTGTSYLRDLKDLHIYESLKRIHEKVYGNTGNLQAGLCCGMNDRMNGMEYHADSEVIVAVTEVVLILGRSEDIVDLNWKSSMAECFYLQAGTVLEIFSNTLHLAPCRTNKDPFCTIIILPEGTNKPLEDSERSLDPTYFMKNKWLICHSESPAVARGGIVGISGKNIQIQTT